MSRGAQGPSGESSRRTRVLLVDDHPIVREGLTRVIDQEIDFVVCATATNSREALDSAATARPQVALVDVSLDGSHGIDLVRELTTRFPDIVVLMLSMHDETLYAERALRAGARGYVMKREPPKVLVEAMRKALRGALAFSETVTARMLTRASHTPSDRVPLPIERLSNREIEVLELIGQGRKTREIAEQLHLSMKTIQAHREHLKEKLELPDATSLARFAVQWVEGGMPGS